MMNAMVLLMLTLTSCDRKHIIVMYVPNTNDPEMPYICHVCQLVHVHMRQLCH